MRGKITLNNLLIILGIIFSVRPYYIQHYEQANNIWKYIAMILAVIMLVRLISHRYINGRLILYITKENKIFYLFSIWCVLFIAVTLFRGSDSIISLLSNIAQSLLAFSSFALVATDGSDQRQGLKIIHTIYAGYILIDAFTIFFGISSLLGMPSDVTSFLGHYDNYASFEILIMLGVIFESSYLVKGKISGFDVFLYICAFASKIYSFSVTAILGFAVFGILCLVRKQMNKKTIRIIIVVETVANILAILMASYTHFYLYLGTFMQRIGKSGFGYRETIWPKAINAIFQSPIFGYGELGSNETFQSVVGLSIWDTEASHCHNLLLQILFNTGFLGLIILLSSIRRAVRIYMTEERNSDYLIFGFIAYMGISIMDGYIFTYVFWGLIGFMAYYEDVVSLPVSSRNEIFTNHVVSQPENPELLR